MMAYLLWRVATGRNQSIEYNFLIAGHTKFSCDLCFGHIKKKTRKTHLTCLKDIQDVSVQTFFYVITDLFWLIRNKSIVYVVLY